MLLQIESHTIVFYRSNCTLRMHVLAGLRDAGQRVRTCISRSRGKGNQRRAANYSATPAITIYSSRHVNSFFGPGYSSAIAGHAASRNTFLERLFIAPDFSDDAEFSEPENAGLNQRRFRFPVSPRVRGARGVGPAFPAAVARSRRYQDSLIKTLIRPA